MFYVLYIFILIEEGLLDFLITITLICNKCLESIISRLASCLVFSL